MATMTRSHPRRRYLDPFFSFILWRHKNYGQGRFLFLFSVTLSFQFLDGPDEPSLLHSDTRFEISFIDMKSICSSATDRNSLTSNLRIFSLRHPASKAAHSRTSSRLSCALPSLNFYLLFMLCFDIPDVLYAL